MILNDDSNVIWMETFIFCPQNRSTNLNKIWYRRSTLQVATSLRLTLRRTQIEPHNFHEIKFTDKM